MYNTPIANIHEIRKALYREFIVAINILIEQAGVIGP